MSNGKSSPAKAEGSERPTLESVRLQISTLHAETCSRHSQFFGSQPTPTEETKDAGFVYDDAIVRLSQMSDELGDIAGKVAEIYNGAVRLLESNA